MIRQTTKQTNRNFNFIYIDKEFDILMCITKKKEVKLVFDKTLIDPCIHCSGHKIYIEIEFDILRCITNKRYYKISKRNQFNIMDMARS